MQVRATAHSWGLRAALVIAMCAFAAPVSAQPRGKKAPPPADKTPKQDPGDKSDKSDKSDKPSVTAKESGTGKVKNFDFSGLSLNGSNRSPQLLYFLERANEELECASLEKRSFILHMVKSVEEESL